MKIGFLNNQVDNRGTGNALFDYAHYNEEILGNESRIFSLDNSERDDLMETRLLNRFGKIYVDRGWFDLDVLYHIKSGYDDGFRTPEGVRYAVHAVFDYQPHGDRYAVVSPWMGAKYNSPFVPHIVNLPETTDDLRRDLAIPKDAIVFGRHGGVDSFDIPWAWSAIDRALKTNPNVWFLFMNTNRPYIKFYDDQRVIFIDPTANPRLKRAFINACDAMLHARGRGETFGIAVGEFSYLGKPIVTYANSPERNHLEEVAAYTYADEDELFGILSLLDLTYERPQNGYIDYTPEKVMAKFKEVFLD